MIRRPPRSTRVRSSAASDVYKRQISPGSWLYQSIQDDKVPSLIFWGPPGSGKTTLAFIIAQETKSDFIELSATSSGIKDLKLVVERASENRRLGQSTILFVDEIHRWN